MTGLLVSLATMALIAAQLPVIDNQRDDRYIVMREFVSPITGDVFYAPVLRKEQPVISWDYDRCPHPPINTLAYTLVIDPTTGYTAPPDEFNNPVGWDAADIERILGQPHFSRSAPESLPWAGAFAWEKLENAALLAAASEDPEYIIANWWLMAAWSVRLDVISGENEFDDEVERLFSILPSVPYDAGDINTLYEIQIARQWEKKNDTGGVKDVKDSELALALAWLYRSRGELSAASIWLRTASLHDPELAETSVLYQYLESSISLEKQYLITTRLWLKRAWDKRGLPPHMEGGTAFILGELNRRLGEVQSAVVWYNMALEKNMGMISNGLIEHQRDLCVNSHGY